MLFEPQQSPNKLIIQVCPTSEPQSPDTDMVRFGRKMGPCGGCTLGRIVIDMAECVVVDCCDELPLVDDDGGAEDVGSVDVMDAVVRRLVGSGVDVVTDWEVLVVLGVRSPPGEVTLVGVGIVARDEDV